MAKKAVKKEVDINTKIVEELGSLIVCVETQKWYNFEIG